MTDAETTIRSILGQVQDAFSARDLDALSDLIDDDIVLFGTSKVNLGRDEATTYLAQMIALPGIIQWRWDTVVPLVNDAALLAFAVIGSVRLEDSHGELLGPSDPFRLTIIAVERDGRWRLAHFHGSVPQTD